MESAETRLCRGSGGVPQFLNLPPRVGARGLNQDDAMTMQQNAAGVRGVPEILFSVPPRVGARGLNQDDVMTVQQNAAGVRGVPEILFSVPHDWGIKGG